MSIRLELLSLNRDTDPPDPVRCVVKLKNSTWCDKRGLHYRTSLNYLKRASGPNGYNFLEDEMVEIPIVNLHECVDGYYELVTCNHGYDWESGTLDSWDYRLIPYVKDKK